MLFRRRTAPSTQVRLGYCTNLHPARDLDDLIGWLERVARPLADRLGCRGLFGVGLYLPAELVSRLARERELGDRARHRLRELALDPFTFNAFPYGAFGADAGAKEQVFAPDWSEANRLAYTLDVAEFALGCAREREASHVSISTHTGAHAARLASEAHRAACREGLARAVLELDSRGIRAGKRIVLALEPEPRCLCNDTRELSAWLEQIAARVRAIGTAQARSALQSLGSTLDTCHAAVEFEAPGSLLGHATAGGASLGKVQFTSALRVLEPGTRAAAREALFRLDEPRYLHQVTARRGEQLLRAGDLGEARARFAANDAGWLAAEELRCHFHVPVDLEGALADGLGTTRAEADLALESVLEAPKDWGTDELHVEIETYTWDILPRALAGAGELIDGLEREYRHVIGVLERAGYAYEAEPA